MSVGAKSVFSCKTLYSFLADMEFYNLADANLVTVHALRAGLHGLGAWHVELCCSHSCALSSRKGL